jgi:hypothetical protein
MGQDYIPLEEAARMSGLHPNTLKRLLREDVIRGFKGTYRGQHKWLVSVSSLKQYADPMHGFLLEKPGPKLFLRRLNEEPPADENDE